MNRWSVLHIHVRFAGSVIEAPKLSPFKGQMRARLANVLGLDLGFVNVKATRGEGMGFIGRGEGAATLAIATVER